MKSTINLEAKVTGIEEATEKLEMYVELIKEAKTIADELASIEFSIEINDLVSATRNIKRQQSTKMSIGGVDYIPSKI